MSKGRNWAREHSRRQIARSGSDDIAGRDAWRQVGELLHKPLTPQKSKAELRAEAEAAIAGAKFVKRQLRCTNAACGHVGNAQVPTDRPAPRFRCSKCGERIE